MRKFETGGNYLDYILGNTRVRIMFGDLEPFPQGRKPEGAGYHVASIVRGVYGESSKILEESQEFGDAVRQGCKVMAILELADLYGAMRAYMSRNGMSMSDLEKMSDITERAFRNGYRTSRD